MNKLISSILVVIIFLSSTSKTLAEDLCVTTGTGYTVAFFNGVWNTEQDAFDSMLALSEAVGTSFNGEQVNFTLIDLSPQFKTMTLMRFPIKWNQWRSQNEKTLHRRTNHQSHQAA